MSTSESNEYPGKDLWLALTLWANRQGPRLAWQNLLVAIGYWLLAFLVKWYFSRYQMWPAPIWAPAGIALFAALAMGRRSWPGIFLGSLVTNMVTFREPFVWAAVVSAGNSVAPIFAAQLLLKRVRVDELFSKVRHFLYFSMYTIFAGVISATVGVCTFWASRMGTSPDLWGKWSDWIFSDVGACLLFTPMFLLWQHHRPSLRETERPHELLISTVVAVMAVLYLLFGSSGVLAADAGASFLILLPLLWMAGRLSLGIAYPMFLTAIVATIAGTMAGYGPFSRVAPGGALVIFAQMAYGFGSSVLLLGAAANEQRTAEKSLRRLNQELECRVELRTAALRASQQRLEKAALYDSLTGLPNRRMLEDRFASLGSPGQRSGDRLGLLLIDLDHFKQINDNFGHDAGDALLVEAGCRLTTSVRDTDTVARMGGDEFAVLLSPCEGPEGIEAVCRRILKSFADSMSFNQDELKTGASIGIAIY